MMFAGMTSQDWATLAVFFTLCATFLASLFHLRNKRDQQALDKLDEECRRIVSDNEQ
jgi:hypothetical protein